METKPRNGKAWLMAAAAATGIALGAAGIAGAATTGSTGSTGSSSSSAATGAAPAANAPDPAKMANGPGETLLTGTTADQVKAAALAAVPGATVIRVETDSAGSPYEAHLTKADSTQVTVKVDANFKVTATENGFGGGPGGPGGQPPAGAGSSSSSSSSA
jgi:uncharacterized membrane protein YkoI